MQIDERNNLVSLFDVYGKLLSKKEFSVMELYLNHDYGETEIAELSGETRQGVYDAIKKAKVKFDDFEEKLGVIKMQNYTKKLAKSALNYLNSEKIDCAIEILKELQK